MMEERYSQWQIITIEELQAYMGFMILMGIVRLPALDDYWKVDEVFHYAPIAKRISRERFREIHKYLHFADNISLPIRGQPGYDRLGKVRPVIDFFNKKFIALYNSGRDQSIDEAMVPYKGRSSLKQYMPKKPIKRGFKVWVRAEADIGYVSEFEVYTGKKDDGPKKKEKKPNTPNLSLIHI